jgi:hypothetical protein
MFLPLHAPADASRPTAGDGLASQLGAWTGRGRDDPARLQQTRQWLARRLRRLYPGREATSVEFLWYRRTIALNQSQPRRGPELVDARLEHRYVVDLRDAG